MKIKQEYILQFNNYPPKCIDLLINLSQLFNQDDAFEILTSIPCFQNTKTEEEITNKRFEIIKYNYLWSSMLYINNIDINIIKLLLSNLVDYYYIDILNINSIINDSLKSYELIMNTYDFSKNRKTIYYQLRTYKIDHFNAYSLSLLKSEYINKIFEVLHYNYNDVNILKKIINFSKEQIEYLKISRFAYSSRDEFNYNMHIIVNNAINHQFISSDNFELNKKGEFIINQ